MSGNIRRGESAKLVREQLQRIKPDLQKQFRLQACRAFDRVVLPGGAVYSIEEKFQVVDEQILQRAQGQACLRKFLDEKKLIYQPGDALDVDRFLKDDRLHKAATNILHAGGTEAAWWFGLMENGRRKRVVRALRILVEAVK